MRDKVLKSIGSVFAYPNAQNFREGYRFHARPVTLGALTIAVNLGAFPTQNWVRHYRFGNVRGWANGRT